MPKYDYICRTCGERTTLDRLPKDGVEMRHLVSLAPKYEGVSRVCGTFRRDWSSIGLLRENIRAVPRG